MFEIFLVFLRLGLTSFGGPVAHIGYFHNEFVRQRKWVSDDTFTGWLALCQFLPGPASSQLGFLIGLHRGGVLGALLAWFAFTMPSAILLVVLAIYGFGNDTPWAMAVVHGLKLVAVAVVAQAVWSMWSTLCKSTVTRVIALVGFALAIWFMGWSGQIWAILAGALTGIVLLRSDVNPAVVQKPEQSRISPAMGLVLLVLALALLLLMPLFASQSGASEMFFTFYRAGALVFGGGHVVLPMLQSAVVDTGLVSRDAFLMGYGLAQAVPGPLFTFAAWVGALDPSLPGWPGAMLALVAVFLPGMLFVCGVLPWWQKLRSIPAALGAFAGINAAVVGVLAAAWINPIMITAFHVWIDVVVAALAAVWLIWGRAPAWRVVLLCIALALAGYWTGLWPVASV